MHTPPGKEPHTSAPADPGTTHGGGSTQGAKGKGGAAWGHAGTRQGSQRADAPYKYGAPDQYVDLNRRPVFRFWALAPGGKVGLLRFIEQVTWDDENAILHGEIVVRELMLDRKAQPQLEQGYRVLCEVDEGAGFAELWTMRCYKPAVAASNMQRTYELVNDLDLLRQSEGDFNYRPKRHTGHPHGWFGDEIIHDVCKRYKVKAGRIYKGRRRWGFQLAPGVSPLEVIRKVVYLERKLNGRRLVTTYERGQLSVMPLKRSKHLLALGPTLIEAAFQSELPPEFASALSVRGNMHTFLPNTDMQGRRKKKINKMHVELESPASVRQYGYVKRIRYSPDAKTDADLRAEGRAWLVAVAKPLRHLTLTHAGMPRLHRGDAIQLALGDMGLRNQIVFVREVQHTLRPSGYRMDVTVIFDDPYINHRNMKILQRLKGSVDEATATADLEAQLAAQQTAGNGSPQKNDGPEAPFQP